MHKKKSSVNARLLYAYPPLPSTTVIESFMFLLRVCSIVLFLLKRANAP